MWIPAIIISKEYVATYAMNGYKIVLIDENINQYANIPNLVSASILLPPYEVISLELDNNIPAEKEMYNQWLMQKECWEFITLIAVSVIMGTPIALCFGEGTEMKYPSIFLEFLAMYIGLHIGPNSSAIDDYMVPVVLSKALCDRLIPVEAFFKLMPIGVDLVPEAVQFLIMELRPVVFKQNPTLEDYAIYFKNLIGHSHQEGKYLYSPFVTKE